MKYKNASEDPLYWIMTLGLLLFGSLSYWLSPALSIGILFSLIGVMLYNIMFSNRRLLEELKREINNHKKIK